MTAAVPPAIIVGDFNLSADEVAQIAEQLGGEFVRGHGVDHAIIVGDLELVSVYRHLPRYDSDHAPLLLTVRITGSRYSVRILWWNVYVGAPPASVLRAVCELADRYVPDVIVLGEAKRCRELLGRVPAYRHRQGRTGEARNMAVLVRRQASVLRRGWLAMREPWIGPRHDLRHGPRDYPYARVASSDREAVVRVLAVHFPTGGYDGRNVRAVRESVERVIAWAARSSP